MKQKKEYTEKEDPLEYSTNTQNMSMVCSETNKKVKK